MRCAADVAARNSEGFALASFRMIFATALVISLSACATTPPLGGAPGVSLAETTAMPVPDIGDYGPGLDEAAIRPLDVIEVNVFGIEELSRTVRVGANGAFDYPLIGNVQAMGLTTEQLSAELELRLRQTYVRNPDVTSQITTRSDQFFTIGGEVSRPGRYPVGGLVNDPGRFPASSTLTLMQAVAIGGGLEEFASRDEVLVFRTVEGQRYIGVYNMEGIERGNYADPVIYPGDFVVVGESESRRRLELILGLIPAITQPLILLERIAQ